MHLTRTLSSCTEFYRVWTEHFQTIVLMCTVKGQNVLPPKYNETGDVAIVAMLDNLNDRETGNYHFVHFVTHLAGAGDSKVGL